MASLNNYLKGNLLLQKGFHNASVETSIENLKVCQKLFQFSLQENIQAKDRNILIINFDIGKHKRFLYNSLGGAEVKYENKKIVQVQSKVFLIEYDFDFDSAIKEDINSINALIAEFNSEVLKKHPQPLFLFIQGLEILELYLNPTDIYYWLLNILNDFACLKQAYFFVQRDILSLKMMEFLETIVNCRVLIETQQQTEDTLKGLIQMVLFKNSGFSYIENYQVSLKGDQKILCKIEKITKEVIEAQKTDEKDLQKFFKTPFKLEVTDAEKKLKEKVELPHMKAQNPETVWKDFLLETENQDLDPEQDEDEDLDV